MLETVTVGALAFASTNIDDIVLLAVWFAQPRRHIWSIVLGQYLGISALVAVSVLGALTALVIPSRWIPLIGLLPLALGVRMLISKADDDSVPAAKGAGVLGVATVTVANGADNIGVYIPMFASRPDVIPWYAVIFAIGTAVWCALGHYLVAHPGVGPVLRRYGHRVLPWVLIAIGVRVLMDFELSL